MYKSLWHYSMQIAITHLTRMRPGFICTAGIDLATRRQVRPLFRDPLTVSLLRKNGGPLEIGAVIDIGKATKIGSAPEFEDHLVSQRCFRFVRNARPDEFWGLLSGTSSTSLRSVFGPDLVKNGTGCTVELRQGLASLGHLVPQKMSPPEIGQFGKLRLQLSDGELHPYLSVTDIRFDEADHTTPRSCLFEALQHRLAKSSPIVAVGLSRKYRKPNETVERHWLQINNLHFPDDPLGAFFNF